MVCVCVCVCVWIAAKQAWRKQQLRTWKLQQQEEQRSKQEEEEERRKREDEIRKIRDLSNQDEQYNRFMKLVGSRHRSRSKVSRSSLWLVSTERYGSGPYTVYARY